MKKCNFYIWLILISSVFLIGLQLVHAQSDLSNSNKDDNDDKKTTTIILNPKLLNLAENYVYFLEQLDFLTNDYAKYLIKGDSGLSAEYLIALSSISKNLSQGLYLKDLQRINKDLIQLELSLQSVEASDKKIKLTLKDFKRLEKLRDEVEIIVDLYTDEVQKNLEECLQTAELQVYLYERQKKIAETNQNRKKIREKESLLEEIISKQQELASMEARLSEMEESEKVLAPNYVMKDGKIAIVYVPEAPEPADISELDEMDYIDTMVLTIDLGDLNDNSPSKIIVTTGSKAVVLDKYGKYNQRKNKNQFMYSGDFIDSSFKINSDIPILILNPTGDLSITNWDKKYILSKASIIVSSDSDEKAQKTISDIEIRIYNKNDRLYVETVIPKIHDHRTMILQSTVEIKVPKINPIICKSSYGMIEITDLKNNLRLNSDNSEIVVRGMRGKLEISNKDGSVTVEHIEGQIIIENAYAPVMLSDCVGDLKIQNLYSPIEIYSSQGDGTIKNSGLISLTDFKGNLEITNKQNEIFVNQYEGELLISGTHCVLRLDDLQGIISVTTTHRKITAKNIEGNFSAANKLGSIFVSHANGPLTLTNVDGDITINLDEEIRGNSLINSIGGQVNLNFYGTPDLFLTAKTDHGYIKGFIPMDIVQKGSVSSTEYTFGNGKNRLEVEGTSSDIKITEK